MSLVVHFLFTCPNHFLVFLILSTTGATLIMSRINLLLLRSIYLYLSLSARDCQCNLLHTSSRGRLCIFYCPNHLLTSCLLHLVYHGGNWSLPGHLVSNNSVLNSMSSNWLHRSRHPQFHNFIILASKMDGLC